MRDKDKGQEWQRSFSSIRQVSLALSLRRYRHTSSHSHNSRRVSTPSSGDSGAALVSPRWPRQTPLGTHGAE